MKRGLAIRRALVEVTNPSAIPNRPGELCSISVIEASRAGAGHWRFICRSTAVPLDEHGVQYTPDERRELQHMTAWEIEQADPLPAKQGNWEHVWRFKLAVDDGFSDALPVLLRVIRDRFPRQHRLTICVD